MDKHLKIRLIVSKILINVEFSEENIGMSRNRENSMTIALWEGLARTSLNLEFCQYRKYACCHDNSKKNVENEIMNYIQNNS